ncbi:hypothetical protein EC973_006383 [Apophysomyces ossiformis]|uniref:Peptidase M13 C-terminal domain-containing protein n=1 Tax=Apophysomyces ossiformis TaxID=679940 RepID=A0A8H7BWE2_9FUNG|nr:hypothetical protein EC973_006383 [Apophysomyces ossiformis]
MDLQMGYPASAPDIRSPISLAEYYNGIRADVDDFFGNLCSARAWRVKKSWAKLGTAIDRKAWQKNPQDTSVYYNRELNQLILPAGVLLSPIFDVTAPEYLNFGSLGSMVGHELLHGFDEMARWYDGQGKKSRWWTNQTAKFYEERAACYAEQYSKFSVTGPEGQIYHVDGNRTLDNNIADHGGLSLSYAIWRERFENEEYNNVLLPGLDSWTPDQLFYINFGRMRCSKNTAENAVHEVYTNKYAPDRWRVNGPLINSKHFSETFQCPNGAPMNPADKCAIW